MSLTTGTSAGRYEIVPTLGYGGMGEVFRASEMKRDHTGAVRIPETVAVRAASRQRQRAAKGSDTRRQRWTRRMINAFRRSSALTK